MTQSAPQKKQNNIFAKLFIRLACRTASVTDVQAITPHYYLLSLAGDDLKNANATAGDVFQVELGNYTWRAYTVIDWDNVEGKTRTLIYAHGDAPGSNWARSVRVGETCDIYGPRPVYKLPDFDSQTFIFGDETSIGFVASVAASYGLSNVTAVLEVSDLAESQTVLSALNLASNDSISVVERGADDAHLSAIERQLAEGVDAGAFGAFILTGKSTSMLRLRQILNQRRVASALIKSRPYWIPGKAGN